MAYGRFGWERRPAPKARPGSYRRKYGTSPWGKQFLAALERMDYSGRLGRGKTYANKGLVEAIEQPRPGRIEAQVQGSMPRPYHVSIDWQPWPAGKAEELMDDLLRDPALIGGLLNGGLPTEIAGVAAAHDLSIFPEAFPEMKPHCSCPDWAVPCKHLAALFYVMAGAIDADANYLFRLRGLDIQARVREEGLLEDAGTTESHLPYSLSQLTREIAAAPPFQWDEDRYRAIDLSRIEPDGGWRALSHLPENPPFDGKGGTREFFNQVYSRTARKAGYLWLTNDAKLPDAKELLPPGTQLDLQLGPDLRISTLSAFDDDDIAQLELSTDADVLEWLRQIEQLDRHLLNKEARSLLLHFQIARALARQRAYVPRLLYGDDTNGAVTCLIQYIPALNDGHLQGVLAATAALTAPTLLYYTDPAGDLLEFTPEAYSRQLISALLGAIVREADPGKPVDGPFRRMAWLRGRQTFDLVGTEEFPAAILRWLDQLYLAEARYVPLLQIEETGAGLEVDVAVRDREHAGAIPIGLSEWLDEARSTDRLTMIKTLSFLGEHFTDLRTYLSAAGERKMQFTVSDFTRVLTAVLPTMRALGVNVVLPKALQKLLRPTLGLSANASREVHDLSGIISLDAILSFKWQTALGGQAIDAAEFRALVEGQSGLVRYRDQYVMIDREEVQKLLEQLDAGGPDLAPHERLEALFTEEYAGGPVRLDANLQEFVATLRRGVVPELPAGLRATLRPYQLRGYGWLHQNAQLGFGSVLADDMGLGKTLQVITLLLKFAEQGALADRKALVVVPTSLLTNWRREIERFAPALRAHVYHGSGRKLPAAAEYDVLLTTYGLARTENAKLAKMKWEALVIDEAQAIKNPAAKQTKAIKKIDAPVRIAMSGTPVENRMLDYWSVLDFTLPKFLGSRKYFNEHYGRPIQGEHDRRVADRFRRLTAPFVLRRLKTDKNIIGDLPDKVVQTEHCRLTPEQTALYESILEENMRAVESADSSIGRQGLILKLITALKQCCNHPAQFLGRPGAKLEESGKSALLRDRVASILENGDKALIFTQYRAMGDLLREMLRDRFGVEVPFLHGGVSQKARAEMVDRFQSDDACPLFLISIKAGGTGLNLTAANHVIHYDLWWNPAVEAQATDRAYRIGQERTVFVHRLVSEGTFEEKIDALIQSKRQLADLSVVEGETSVGKLSDRELGELVRLG